MIRCETIFYRKYIASDKNYDNVPNKDGSYLVLKGGEIHVLDWYNGYASWFPYNANYYDVIIDDSDITYFAELPAGFDPDSKTFNFQTALELMKQCSTNVLTSCVSGVSYFLLDIGIMTVGDGETVDKSIGRADGFTLAEILGKWELAEE